MKIVSWNVNGLRACLKYGFAERAAEFDAYLDNMTFRLSGEINILAQKLLENVMLPAAQNAVAQEIEKVLNSVPDEVVDDERDKVAEAVVKAIALYEKTKTQGQ